MRAATAPTHSQPVFSSSVQLRRIRVPKRARMGLYALEGEPVAAFTVHRTLDTRLSEVSRAVLHETRAGSGWVVPRALELCPEPELVYYAPVARGQLERRGWFPKDSRQFGLR